MKISRLAGAVGVATALSFTAACGGVAQGSPEDAAKSFLQAIHDEDAEAVCTLTLGEDGKPQEGDALDECIDEAQKGIDEDAKEREDDEAAAKEYDEQRDATKKAIDDGPTDVSEDGDSATVTYEVDGEEAQLPLQKVDGKWYFGVSV